MRHLNLRPAFRAFALRMRARAREGSIQESIADLERARELDPANPWTYAYLGEDLMKTGKWEEAAIRARQALAIEPETVSYSELLAEALEKSGDLEESLDIFARLCDLHEDQRTCANHAMAQRPAGRHAEARLVARKAGTLEAHSLGCKILATFWALDAKPSEAITYLACTVRLAGPATSTWIADDPNLVSLHGRSDFQTLVAEVNRQIQMSDEKASE